jgi:hypothetical protein
MALVAKATNIAYFDLEKETKNELKRYRTKINRDMFGFSISEFDFFWSFSKS